MAYAVLLLELIFLLPFATFIRKNPKYVPHVWFAIGLLMFMYTASGVFGLSIYKWPLYAGHNKGVEITLIDILAVALLIAQSGDKAAPKPPFRAAMAFYFLVTLASIAFAQIPVAAAMYAAQLPRMYLLYVAVYRASAQQRNIDALLSGLAAGLISEFAVVIYQRFAGGMAESVGTFSHRNSLGFAVNLVFLPMVSLLLAARTTRLVGAGALTGMATIALLASRAAAGLAGIGLVLVYGLSLVLKPTGRKVAIGFAGLAVAAIIIPLALSSLEHRMSDQEDTGDDYDERAAFIEAAAGMLRDHPFGIGANNFVIVANTGGYFDAAGVAAVPGSRSAHVHNIYWLTLAELGYLGFVALVWLLAGPIIFAFRQMWRYRKSDESNFFAGIFVALLIACIHSYFEWIMITTVSQHFLVATWGMAAGIAARLKAVHQVGGPSQFKQAIATEPEPKSKLRTPHSRPRASRIR